MNMCYIIDVIIHQKNEKHMLHYIPVFINHILFVLIGDLQE